MNPMLLTGLLLLATTLVLALMGILLVQRRKVRRNNASRFTQISTLVVLAAAYALTYTPWGLLQLRSIDFISVLVIAAIAAYSLVWASVAYWLNKPEYQQEFGESFMLSMLYTDAPQQNTEFPSTKVMERSTGGAEATPPRAMPGQHH